MTLKIVAIGECLLELTHQAQDQLRLNYAGDTYNTCYYLAQLNKDWLVSYCTALGTDDYSHAMRQTWQKQRVDTQLCLLFEDKNPGLYLVNTDATGERSFIYFRTQSAASQMFLHADINQNLEAMLAYDYLYLTGISFAILPQACRQTLLDFVRLAKSQQVGIIYDNNYRQVLWENSEDAQQLAKAMADIADVVFVTHDDEALLFGDAEAKTTLHRYQAWRSGLTVVKDGPNRCFAGLNGENICQYPPEVSPVIDTTGAGDAFNAAFLAAYWRDQPIQQALMQANQLASRVIQTSGALVPQSELEYITGFPPG